MNGGNVLGHLAIAIRYQNKPARAALVALSALFPLWAIVFPIWFALLTVLLLKIPGALPPLVAGCTLALLGIVPLLAFVSTAFVEDDQLIISRDGLCFPLLFLPGLRFRREFPWHELRAIHLHWQGNKSLSPDDSIDLFFGNGGCARIKLNALGKEDLEQLLLALSLWAGDRGDEHHLFQLQTHLRGGEAERKRLSITELWEEELASRFRPASFVPLKSDTKLQSGRLTILKQLGFGGFSATYLAQRSGRELVVVKETADQENQPEGKNARSIEHEAAILTPLNHPGIARLLDHFVEKGRQYLVLQYIPGTDLRQLVREQGWQGEASVLQWGISVCGILEYLHNRTPHVLHLDITPENLLLRRDGEICLIDFGVAILSTGQKAQIASGKKSYMAPEQIQLSPTVQSDVYALGCTLYYLLTGKDPEPLTPSSPRSLRADLSPELDGLILQCTAANTSSRVSSAQALKERLGQISRGEKPPAVATTNRGAMDV
jgi:hypothetical protein